MKKMYRPPRKPKEKNPPQAALRIWKNPAKKATPEVLQKILEGLALGLTRAQACADAGVSTSSLNFWEHRPEFEGLRAATEAARIKVLLEKINNCTYMDGDWKRYKWQLEFAFPEQCSVGAEFAQQNNFFLTDERSRQLSDRAKRLLENNELNDLTNK